MVERIPQRIDYYRYTDKGVILDGVITQQELESGFPRLCAAIVKTAGDIEYHLEFDIDIAANRVVTGWLKTQVILQCQRCMNDYQQALSCDVATAFVKNNFEVENAETAQLDTFFVNKQPLQGRKEKQELIDPRTIIEDELLLTLPQIARHAETGTGTNCHIQFDYPVVDKVAVKGAGNNGELNANSSEKVNKQEDDNPFAILKQLKE
jgi:uncharacterized metal-binding protein YceD (DUF177 family)